VGNERLLRLFLEGMGVVGGGGGEGAEGPWTPGDPERLEGELGGREGAGEFRELVGLRGGKGGAGEGEGEGGGKGKGDLGEDGQDPGAGG
jgi:hypothetical protein